MSISALIVDSDVGVRRRLHDLLGQADGIDVIIDVASLRDCPRVIDAIRPDAMFLGVHAQDEWQPDLRRLAGSGACPTTVVVADHGAYAVKAFEIGAAYCLTNPVEPEPLGRALARLREILLRKNADLRAGRHVTAESRKPFSASRIMAFRDGGGFTLVDVGLIRWLDVQGNYMRAYVGDSSYRTRKTMMAMMHRLDARQFLQISRRAIVNVDFVEDITLLRCGKGIVSLVDGTRLDMSPRYSRSVLR